MTVGGLDYICSIPLKGKLEPGWAVQFKRKSWSSWKSLALRSEDSGLNRAEVKSAEKAADLGPDEVTGGMRGEAEVAWAGTKHPMECQVGDF